MYFCEKPNKLCALIGPGHECCQNILVPCAYRSPQNETAGIPDDEKGSPTEKYKHFNHHHEITDDQELVTIGGCEFIADKKMIPLLQALNDLGIQTRTHNYHDEECWVGIVFDNCTNISIRKCQERNSSRTRFNGKTEMILAWKPKTW